MDDEEIERALAFEDALFEDALSMAAPQVLTAARAIGPFDDDSDDDEDLLRASLAVESRLAAPAATPTTSLSAVLSAELAPPCRGPTGGSLCGADAGHAAKRPRMAETASGQPGAAGEPRSRPPRGARRAIDLEESPPPSPQVDEADAEVTSAAGASARTPVEALAQRLEELCIRGKVASAASVSSRGVTGTRELPCAIEEKFALHRATIRGLEVLFPFATGPLPPQQELMERVVEALESGRHGVLESPTGTGKTAAVLCAALAWQRRQLLQTGKALQILFVSRTHAQLRQAIAELGRMPYRPTTAILGSRESGLCVHSGVSSAALHGGQFSVLQACREARRGNDCSFYAGLQVPGAAEAAVDRLRCGQPWDIEDAAAFGKEACMCPYYLSHSLARHAQLVFSPYSYVLDPGVRRAGGAGALDLRGRIVILDEAHNMESICREAGSIEIGIDQLKATLSALKRALGEEGGADVSAGSDFGHAPSRASAPGAEAARAPSGPNEEMGGFLLGAPGPPRGDAGASGSWPSSRRRHSQAPPAQARSARALMALFSRMCSFLTEAREATVYAPQLGAHRQVCALLRSLGLEGNSLLRADPAAAAGARLEGAALTRGEAALRELRGLSSVQGSGATLDLAANLLPVLAAAVATPELYAAKVDPERRAVQLWLMAPEGTLGPVAQALHSLLLMSGTLAPLPATIAELGPTFGSRALPAVAASHVVGSRALKLVAVCQASTTKLECNFRAWKREPFLDAVGEAILTVARAIPAGVLVFLPSYDLLERCIQAWQRGPGPGAGAGAAPPRKRHGAVERVAASGSDGHGIWEQLVAAKKTVVVEPPPLTGPMARGASSSGAQAVAAYEVAKRRYEDAVRSDGKALLLAVYRGRMSEGVSFDDDFARGVICIGIPFPNLTEERLAQKRAFNDHWVSQGLGTVSGNAWYESKATSKSEVRRTPEPVNLSRRVEKDVLHHFRSHHIRCILCTHVQLHYAQRDWGSSQLRPCTQSRRHSAGASATRRTYGRVHRQRSECSGWPA